MNIDDIKSLLTKLPETAIVLGSGLGGFVDELNILFSIDYADIEGFKPSGVDGHKGRLIIADCSGAVIAVMQGRIHYYEGYSMSEVTAPVRRLGDLGVNKIILTNAAGGINKEFGAGDLMIITDHILNAPNPLIGRNDERYGVRFPDMSEIYDKELTYIAERTASDSGIPVKKGVYVQLTGPSYETPAEIDMWRRLGADAVGMSTACEAVVARHAGMKVCGLSCITNAAAAKGAELNHNEVKETASKSSDAFIKLLKGMILRIDGIGK